MRLDLRELPEKIKMMVMLVVVVVMVIMMVMMLTTTTMINQNTKQIVCTS